MQSERINDRGVATQGDTPVSLEERVAQLEALLKHALRRIEELEHDTAVREVCIRRERREALAQLTARGLREQGVVGPYVHASGRKWFALGDSAAQFKAIVRRTGAAEIPDSATGAIYNATSRDGEIMLFDRSGQLVGLLL